MRSGILEPMTEGTLSITGDDEADALLNSDGTAVLIGMLLDQQVPMEWAFRGPATIAERMDGLSAEKIAALDVETFIDLCRGPPAIHRFPKSMGARVHALAEVIVDQYDGDGANVWTDVEDASTLGKRLDALPGFGAEKVKIFTALLAKRFGVAPEGWQDVAGPFADDTPRSAADIDSEKTLEDVRNWKRAQKAKGSSKQD